MTAMMLPPVGPASDEMRILLIEPDSETRGLLELALSARGHDVTSAATTEAAEQALADDGYPLIVLSYELPDDDATRLCRRIRSLPTAGDAVIIVMAKSATDEQRAAAIGAGATDCLIWPADAVALRGHLEAAERAFSVARESSLPLQPDEPAHADRALLVLNRDGTVRDASPLFERWLSFGPDILTGVSAFALLHLDDAPQLLSLSTQALSHAGPTEPVEMRLRGGDDVWHRLLISAESHVDDPEVRGIVLIASRPPGEPPAAGHGGEQMYDPITMLPTYPLFIDRLDHALERSRRRGDPVVVLVIDLEGIAALDERFGSGTLDDVASTITQRTRACLRTGDTVGRLRRDEFAVVVEGLDHPDEAVAVTRRVLRELGLPFELGGKAMELTPRVGIAFSALDQLSAEELLRRARVAHRNARVWPADDGRYTLYGRDARGDGFGSEPAMSEYPVEDAASGGADADIDDSWFTPLMTRIGALEREIARYTEERQARRAGGGHAG